MAHDKATSHGKAAPRGALWQQELGRQWLLAEPIALDDESDRPTAR